MTACVRQTERSRFAGSGKTIVVYHALASPSVGSLHPVRPGEQYSPSTPHRQPPSGRGHPSCPQYMLWRRAISWRNQAHARAGSVSGIVRVGPFLANLPPPLAVCGRCARRSSLHHPEPMRYLSVVVRLVVRWVQAPCRWGAATGEREDGMPFCQLLCGGGNRRNSV